ncbi:hypothetical protein B0T17DRAFT_511091 [Bombardia bombarda]|uniref:Uncharacterized protein n=1 Tax=Bombardia bombarda TaxID=252184 RepID=A0AA40BVN2_9PEZI|nr:hypothetical protein B0T17DRAFT_511091 [Bombardia bombarda]
MYLPTTPFSPLLTLTLLLLLFIHQTTATPLTNPLTPIPLPQTNTQPIPEIGCTNAVNATSMTAALTRLGDFCHDYGAIRPNMKIGWEVGSSRAYACNYAWIGSNPCPYFEIAAAWAAVQEKCGDGVGGYWYRSDWKKTYGFDLRWAGWCGGLDEV